MSLESDVKENKQVVVEPVNVDDCVVCLEPLDDARTLVKLRCGHQFHLDCIGSAYNKKNKMECPTCRHVEKGKWLFAKAVEPPSLPEVDFGSVFDRIQGLDIRSLYDMASDSVESSIDGLLLMNSSMPIPSALDQITDNSNTQFDLWRDDPSLQSLQRQLETIYRDHMNSGGTHNEGGGEAVAEEAPAGEGSEMTEE